MLPWFFWILLIIFIGICVFLILVILLQAGKGGGLSSLIGGAGAFADSLGATGVEKTLNRWTTYCAVTFGILSILLTLIGAHYAKPQSIVDGMEAAARPAPVTEQIPASEGQPPVADLAGPAEEATGAEPVAPVEAPFVPSPTPTEGAGAQAPAADSISAPAPSPPPAPVGAESPQP